MIEADIRGKLGSEDVFTSCCVGLLKLLPDSYFLGFLNKSINLSGSPLNLKSVIKSIDFWPTFWSGFPDVVVKLQDNTVLIVEIKHGGILHGNDQLAKYWCDAYREFSDSKIVLIYLTHHRSIPSDDLKKSEDLAKERQPEYKNGCFFWLNWFNLFLCIEKYWLPNPISLYCCERKIIELLKHYLIEKGYVCFLGWNDVPRLPLRFLHYNYLYDWILIDAIPATYTSIFNLEFGKHLVKAISVACYNHRYNWVVSSDVFMTYTHIYSFGVPPITVSSLCFYSP